MVIRRDRESAAGESGSWLPLHEAARELGILEILAFRLISDGKLLSRRDEGGEIQVWVADADRVEEGPAQVSVTNREERSLALAESLATTVHHQVEILTSSLVASYEQNAQLARENGALTERLAVLERELTGLQDTRERLRASELTNTQLTRMLSMWTAAQDRGDRSRRPWLLGAGVLLLLLVVLVPLVVHISPSIVGLSSTPVYASFR